MTNPHYRRCWECGAINLHGDNVAPEVCCKKCGSRDTRLMKNEPPLWDIPEAINDVYAGSLGRPAIDAELIADAMPALLVELDRLRAEVSRLKSAFPESAIILPNFC